MDTIRFVVAWVNAAQTFVFVFVLLASLLWWATEPWERSDDRPQE